MVLFIVLFRFVVLCVVIVVDFVFVYFDCCLLFALFCFVFCVCI